MIELTFFSVYFLLLTFIKDLYKYQCKIHRKTIRLQNYLTWTKLTYIMNQNNKNSYKKFCFSHKTTREQKFSLLLNMNYSLLLIFVAFKKSKYFELILTTKID